MTKKQLEDMAWKLGLHLSITPQAKGQKVYYSLWIKRPYNKDLPDGAGLHTRVIELTVKGKLELFLQGVKVGKEMG